MLASPVAPNSNRECERDECLGSRCLNTTWRPLSQPIRTAGMIGARIRIVALPVTPSYQRLARKAVQLHSLGVGCCRRALTMGVSRPTIAKALRSLDQTEGQGGHLRPAKRGQSKSALTVQLHQLGMSQRQVAKALGVTRRSEQTNFLLRRSSGGNMAPRPLDNQTI